MKVNIVFDNVARRTTGPPPNLPAVVIHLTDRPLGILGANKTTQEEHTG